VYNPFIELISLKEIGNMLVSDEIIQDQQSQPEWIPLTEAAKRIGVSHGKLSRMAKQKPY